LQFLCSSSLVTISPRCWNAQARISTGCPCNPIFIPRLRSSPDCGLSSKTPKRKVRGNTLAFSTIEPPSAKSVTLTNGERNRNAERLRISRTAALPATGSDGYRFGGEVICSNKQFQGRFLETAVSHEVREGGARLLFRGTQDTRGSGVLPSIFFIVPPPNSSLTISRYRIVECSTACVLICAGRISLDVSAFRNNPRPDCFRN
jgi:hypothetical protein